MLAIPGSRGSQGGGDAAAAPSDFTQRGSFGFGTIDMEDRTSSDAEPGTPQSPQSTDCSNPRPELPHISDSDSSIFAFASPVGLDKKDQV